MAVTNGTNITAIEKPEVGVDTGPGWATSINNSLDGIDGHDHTTNKGSRITPAALNINADLEMNSNDLTEIRTLSMDSTSGTTTADTRAIYVSGSNNLHYRNGSGQDIQITDGTSVVGAAGSITGMGSDAGNQAGASYTDGSKAFNFFTDSGNTDFGKMNHSDLNLYKFSDDNTADTDFVTLQCSSSVSGAGGTITIPGETGTLLTTATNFAGTINVATSSSNSPINLKPNGTGHVVVGNGGATGKLTSNGAFDLVIDTNSGTNSGNITITDGADGNIAITPNGTGEVDISKVDIDGGAIDGVTLGTNSAVTEVQIDNININGNAIISSNTDGNIDLTPNGTGEVNISKVDIDSGAIDGVTIGTNSVVTDLRVDNLKLDGNVISSTNTDGDIDISPNGAGSIDLNSGTLDLSAQTVDVTLNAAVDALNFDSNTLSIDASGNKIGIGTAAPDSKLHVEGGDPGANNALIEAKYTSNTNYPCIQLIQQNTGGNTTDNHGLLIDNRGGAGTSYSIRVKNDTTENFYVKADGKIYFGGVIQSDVETATNKKVKQKGAFMQSSTHQSLVLGY